jgi:signal peptidase I
VFKKKIGQQARWPQTLLLFFLPLFLFFLVRHFIFEPFVIPSESMLPQLKIHDHIVVKKYKYGLRSFFTDSWLIKFRQPERGDIVVFRYPENPKVFFIKRLIGLPGDRIWIKGMTLKVNDQIYELDPSPDYENIFTENNGTKKYSVMMSADEQDPYQSEAHEYTVPANSYFVMGDNRFNSHDSRFWGSIPENLLIGQAYMIWMSCEDMLESAPFICDPMTFRWDQLFKKIN